MLTLSAAQLRLLAKMLYLPSGELMKRKSSWGDEYGKPMFLGSPQRPSGLRSQT